MHQKIPAANDRDGKEVEALPAESEVNF